MIRAIAKIEAEHLDNERCQLSDLKHELKEAKKIPVKVDLSNKLGPVLDQGSINCSAACAVIACAAIDSLGS